MKESIKISQQTTFTPKLVDTNTYLSENRFEFKFIFENAFIRSSKITLMYTTYLKMVNFEIEEDDKFVDYADVEANFSTALSLPIPDLMTTINNPRDIADINNLSTMITPVKITDISFYSKQIKKELENKLKFEIKNKLESLLNERDLLAGCELECELKEQFYKLED